MGVTAIRVTAIRLTAMEALGRCECCALAVCTDWTRLRRCASAAAPLGSTPTGFRCDDDPLCAVFAARRGLARHELLLLLLPRRVCRPLFSAGDRGGMSEPQVRLVVARPDRTVAGSSGQPLV